MKTGRGSLLEEGKKQTYNLGVWLHQRYSHLLSDPSKIDVHTTDVDRVIQSAKCCLAGMFPPHGSYSHRSSSHGDEAVDCTTNIQLHTLPSNEDYVLAARAPCSAYTKEYERVYKSKVIAKKNEEFKDIYATINKMSGSTGRTENRHNFIHKIYDVVLVEKELGLNPDPWAVKIMPQLKKASILSFIIPTWTRKLKRLKSGPLVGQMINDMEDKVCNRNQLDAKLYFGHDGTIVNLLNTLGVYDKKELPDYASCVMLELIDKGHGNHDVKLYYSQSTKPRAKLLIRMPLQDFVKTAKQIVPSDWHKECNEG